jgi:hypothetical protein
VPRKLFPSPLQSHAEGASEGGAAAGGGNLRFPQGGEFASPQGEDGGDAVPREPRGHLAPLGGVEFASASRRKPIVCFFFYKSISLLLLSLWKAPNGDFKGAEQRFQKRHLALLNRLISEFSTPFSEFSTPIYLAFLLTRQGISPV